MHRHKLIVISSSSGDDEIHQYDFQCPQKSRNLPENVCEKAGQVGKKSAALGARKRELSWPLACCGSQASPQ